MSKLTLILGGIILLLLGSLFVLGIIYSNKSNESSRRQDNILDLTKQNYYLKDSLISRVGVVEMTTREMGLVYKNKMDSLKLWFDIKAKDLVRYGETQINTVNEFYVNVRDSLTIDSIEVEVANYQDEWLDFSWVKPIGARKAKVEYSNTVTFIEAVHWTKEKPEKKIYYLNPKWWFKKKSLVRDLKADNPNTKIIYDQVINIVD